MTFLLVHNVMLQYRNASKTLKRKGGNLFPICLLALNEKQGTTTILSYYLITCIRFVKDIVPLVTV